jgi:hypothetical protein
MADRANQSESYGMEISVCEIYNNDVRDLLSDKSTRVSTSYLSLFSCISADLLSIK